MSLANDEEFVTKFMQAKRIQVVLKSILGSITMAVMAKKHEESKNNIA